MKKAVAIGALVLGPLITALLVLPAFVDLGIFKRTYLPLVEEALHRNIDVDNVRLTLLPAPSVVLLQLPMTV